MGPKKGCAHHTLPAALTRPNIFVTTWNCHPSRPCPRSPMKKKLAIAALVLLTLLLVAAIAVMANPLLLMLPFALTGNYSGVRSNAPLAEAHQRAINSFVDARGFGPSRMRQVSYWNDATVLLQEKRYRPLEVQLVALTHEGTNRVYTDATPPLKTKLAASTHRPLTPAELKAVEELQQGSLLSAPFQAPSATAHEDDNTRQVLGALRYTASCLQCHQGKEGQLAGAFLYTLMPLVDGR